jgi:hypothetical protein
MTGASASLPRSAVLLLLALLGATSAARPAAPAVPLYNQQFQHAAGGSNPSDDAVAAREKQIWDSGGSLEPPGPLPMRLHTVYMEYFLPS